MKTETKKDRSNPTQAPTTPPAGSRKNRAADASAKAWSAAPQRLMDEIKAKVADNGPMVMDLRPVMLAEQWRFLAYVSESRGITFDEAAAELIEAGVQAWHERELQALTAEGK